MTLRVVVVDDDHWKRTAMAQELDAHPEIGVVEVIDQDEAVLWSSDRWEQVDVAIVDVFDERAPSEVGTDVFSGIAALVHLRDLPVRTIAITPHCQHPLVELRLAQAKADAVYHRWEVNDVERLAAALLDPASGRAPLAPSATVLESLGARRASTNAAVRLYERSPLSGLLRPEAGLKALRLPRRTIDRFRRDVARTGFDGTEDLSAPTRPALAPRWPDVRDYLLALLGRRNVPPTETDRNDGPLHS